MSNHKCDVIIPVYNAPDWVKLCVYSLMKNSSLSSLNKIYLMNDNSNQQTLCTLNALRNKYGSCIEVITNETNLGFVKNCNKALNMTDADYVLLLNSDCLISSHTIEKLIFHLENDPQIGLICPISSNAANLTLPIFEGFSYTQMDYLLEKKFKGISFDACTVVGNCLMITRDCLNKVGLLDEIYGMGYGEETDYQFKAMEKGFKAKVAIDTYVFHKAEVSFGNSKEKKMKLEKNRKIFFDRWGEKYAKLSKEYEKNDPIKYILKNITSDDKKINVDTLVYLPTIIQNAGGCHVVVDLVNYLSINCQTVNILYDNISGYDEVMLFNPISTKKLEKIHCKQIVSTIWNSTFKAKEFADKKNIPLISFVQGYEAYFENGNEYGKVALTYKLSDYVLTISNYLKYKLASVFNIDSYVIKNGVNADLLLNENKSEKVSSITLFLRGNTMKGDFLLIDLLNMINSKFHGLKINVIYINKITFPNIIGDNEINFVLGPVTRKEMTKIMNETDIYIDCSLNEGFGLLALEALYAGAVSIVSNSFGISEYLIDCQNGFIVNEVNDVDKYFEKIEYLISNPKVFCAMKNSMLKKPEKYDYDNTIHDLIDYFNTKKVRKDDYKLSKYEIELLNEVKSKTQTDFDMTEFSKKRKFMYKLAKIMPQSFKDRIKPLITSLYYMFDH